MSPQVIFSILRYQPNRYLAMSLKSEKQSQSPVTKVLVVEDNIPNMNYLLFILKKLNIPAVSAYSGEEALEVLNNQHIDVMLLDIHLGKQMSGIDLLHELRKKEVYQNTPAVAVTAYYSRISKELIDSGFDQYLAKPFSPDQLKDILDQYIPLEA